MNMFVLLPAMAALVTSFGSAMDDQSRTPEIAPARDGNIAIREELCAARRAATVAAYDLFIARHPDHLLAEIARGERAELVSRRRSPH